MSNTPEGVAVQIVKCSSEVDVSGVEWLAVFISSISYESEYDDAVKCGSVRGKAVLLRSLLPKYRPYTYKTYVGENLGWNRST